MASAPEKDLQALLRLLTTARKLPMLQAMAQVKALQAANLRSIRQIADAPLAAVQAAVKDAAGAKALQNSCKAARKRQAAAAGDDTGGGAVKRAAAETSGTAAKRARPDAEEATVTPADVERALALPVVVPADAEDEARLAATTLQTNRAPLVLAFAVELLRYTMPEQPVSSRLSLAQAVVSANSRSKAAHLGLAGARGPSAEDEGWGAGQPRVRILGREVAVLKRSGYTWRGEEEEAEGQAGEGQAGEGQAGEEQGQGQGQGQTQQNRQGHTQLGPAAGTWTTSQTISLKGSTFVARATTLRDTGQRAALVRALLETHPQLQTATHNAWAYRVRTPSGHVRQDAYDDGETGCGDLMLRVLAELGAADALVVLTRWFGGTLLGPDRWRLMRNCVTGALAERLRRTGAAVTLGGEAVWALDLEAMRDEEAGSGAGRRRPATTGPDPRFGGLTSVVGMPIHRPEAARQYLLRSFAPWEEGGGDGAAAATTTTTTTTTTPTKKKKTAKAADAEKEENLARLLGALRLVYDSWADHLTPAELDRRAWSWYVAVRPDVDSGPAGWGAKGAVRLRDVLALRRPSEGAGRPDDMRT